MIPYWWSAPGSGVSICEVSPGVLNQWSGFRAMEAQFFGDDCVYGGGGCRILRLEG